MGRAEFHYLTIFLQCKHILLFSFVYYKDCNKHLLFYPENFKSKGYTEKTWAITLVGKQRNWNLSCDFTCRRTGRMCWVHLMSFPILLKPGNSEPTSCLLAGHQDNEAISAGQSHSSESHKCECNFFLTTFACHLASNFNPFFSKISVSWTITKLVYW